MQKNGELKRVFFAFEVIAPWQSSLPEGRTIDPSGRHLTIVFLGNIDYRKLEMILESFPKPEIKVGLTGKFDRCLFLPSKRPNVVAWRVKWFDLDYDLDAYQKKVAGWLIENGFNIRLHPNGFLPHVTLARRPFSFSDWRTNFLKLPVFIKGIHLYESLGGLTYKPLWSFPLLRPFDSVTKEENVSMTIRGENFMQLLNHLITCVSFQFPSLIHYLPHDRKIQNIQELTTFAKEILQNAKRKDAKIPSDIHCIQEPKENENGVWIWKVEIPH